MPEVDECFDTCAMLAQLGAVPDAKGVGITMLALTELSISVHHQGAGDAAALMRGAALVPWSVTPGGRRRSLGR